MALISEASALLSASEIHPQLAPSQPWFIPSLFLLSFSLLVTTPHPEALSSHSPLQPRVVDGVKLSFPWPSLLCYIFVGLWHNYIYIF